MTEAQIDAALAELPATTRRRITRDKMRRVLVAALSTRSEGQVTSEMVNIGARALAREFSGGKSDRPNGAEVAASRAVLEAALSSTTRVGADEQTPGWFQDEEMRRSSEPAPDEDAELVEQVRDLLGRATPGPWGCTTRRGSWDWVVYCAAQPNIEVCQPFHDGTKDNERGEANAKLIALVHRMAERISSRDDGLRDRYDELIYAVSMKHEGETRHETALRYIREREAERYGEAQGSDRHG